MTDTEYRDAMDLLANQIRVIEMLPLDHLLATVDRAESVGFLFVAPMDYQRGIDNLRDQRKILKAAIALRDAARELNP